MQYNMDEARNIRVALWFDVERGCNTTPHQGFLEKNKLWFDVERGCNTTAGNEDADG